MPKILPKKALVRKAPSKRATPEQQPPATALASATTSAPAPMRMPAAELPPLSMIIGECPVVIEGIGETISDVVGPFTIAQRLGFAYAELTRTKTSYGSVEVNVLKAFELLEFDPASRRIEARLVPGCPVGRLPAGADPDWIARTEKSEQEPRIIPAESTRKPDEGYGYWETRPYFGNRVW